MKPAALPLLLIVDAALAAGVTGLWLHQRAWQAPPVHPPAAASLAAERLGDRGTGVGTMAQMLARPLFAVDRRAPANAATGEATADALADAVLLGIFGGREPDRGIVVRAEGKVRRLHTGDTLAGWRLVAVRDGAASFTREREERRLPLAYLPQPPAAPVAAEGARPGLAPGRPPMPAVSGSGRLPAAVEGAMRSGSPHP